MSDDISCPFKMKRAGGMKGCVGNMERMQNTTDDDVGGEGLSIIIFQSPEVIHQCMNVCADWRWDITFSTPNHPDNQNTLPFNTNNSSDTSGKEVFPFTN